MTVTAMSRNNYSVCSFNIPKAIIEVHSFFCCLQYYSKMLESGIYVRDFGTRLEEIELADSGYW